MKYKVLKSCRIHNRSCPAGEVVELNDSEAKELMAMGRVAPHHEPVVEHRAVGVEGSSDGAEKPLKRAKAKKVDG
jgi:hypothetical protein